MARKMSRKRFIIDCGKRIWQAALGLTVADLALPLAYADSPHEKTGEVKEKPLPFRLEPTSVLTPSHETITGVAFDTKDNLYVTGSGGIEIFNEKRQALKVLKTGELPCCVVVDEEGNIFAAHRTGIICFNSEGRQTAAWGTKGKGRGEFLYITGLAVSGDFLYITDAGNRRLHHFSVDGDFVDDRRGFIIPSGYFDCAVDSQGILYVGHTGRHRVERFGRNGELLNSWGKPGVKRENFCGCCNPTYLALFPEGNIATIEKGIPRLKVYDPSGKLLAYREINAPASGESGAEKVSAGMDAAVSSKGEIAVAVPSQRAVRFYRLVPFNKKTGQGE